MRRTTAAATAAVLMILAGGCSGSAPDDEPASIPSASTSSAAPQQTPVSASPTTRPSASPSASPSAPPAEPVTLPRGGREVFPRYRLVGYSGVTGAKTLGRLGTGKLDQRIREMEQRAKPYADGREILPVLEVIATVVQPTPGRDKKFRTRMADRQIETYVKAARKRKAIVLLNIQPGRSSFMTEVKAYEKWLREPDVGVALDPEWAMHKGQIPGQAYGYTSGAELDGVARYLADLVERHDLPEKVMVYHQVSSSVVRKESGLKDHPGVALVKSVDGLGPPGPKKNTYRVVNQSTPRFVHGGFKLFYTEDQRNRSRLMTPAEVLALKPKPEYVLYE
ncbi:MAG TPA: hypothetical protein VIT20_07605 [Propionibacteriaceae bacterium]